jgi:hypothetical protein
MNANTPANISSNGEVPASESSGNVKRFVKPLRPNYQGPEIKIRKGEGKQAQVTDETRHQIVLDHSYLIQCHLQRQSEELQEVKRQNELLAQGKRLRQSSRTKAEDEPSSTNFASQLANHYGLSHIAVRAILKDADNLGKLTSGPGRGRPKLVTDDVKSAILSSFNDCKGRTSYVKMKSKIGEQVTWLTNYKGETNNAPSTATICRTIAFFVIGFVRPRPELNDRAKEERRAFAPLALTWDDTKCGHIDEAYVCPQSAPQRYMYDPLKGKDIDVALRVAFDAGGQVPPKIFLIALVVKPMLVEIEGAGIFIHPQFDGKIALGRVRGVTKYKRSGQGFRAGDQKFENVTINGARYKQIFEMEGGFLDMIDLYLNPDIRPVNHSTAKVILIDLDEEERLEKNPELNESRWAAEPMETIFTLQEDGAPGHGYDNIHNKPTSVHEDLVHNASTVGVKFVKQSRHSPETNANDLGIWCVLKTSVEHRWSEIPPFDGRNQNAVEAGIWKIVKEEWDNMDPRKIFMIFEQRRVMLRRIIDLNGESITVEPHTGLRKKWAHLKHDPEFVRQQIATNPASVKEYKPSSEE